MGFKLSQAVSASRIAFTVKTKDERDGSEMQTPVVHVFRMPTAAEREQHLNDMADLRRKKVEIHAGRANRALWLACCTSVEGYDDLTAEAAADPKQFQAFFLASDILKAHVNAAVRMFMGSIEEEQVDLEKNSAG